jgi:hypothetical protein
MRVRSMASVQLRRRLSGPNALDALDALDALTALSANLRVRPVNAKLPLRARPAAAKSHGARTNAKPRHVVHRRCRCMHSRFHAGDCRR